MNCTNCRTRRLPSSSWGVGFACDDQLNRTLGMGQYPSQTVGIVEEQVGPFVSGKTSGKPQRQHMGIEHRSRLFDRLRVGAILAALPHQVLTRGVY
jgi:hypothetical protein